MEENKKIALVIGGSRGIGRATAFRLARSGYTIWLTYRSNHSAAEEVKSDIVALGSGCVLLPFDIANREETEAALKPLVDERAPDVVVFNAGVARDNLMVFMTPEEWDSVIDTNLTGFYNVIHVVLFSMLSQKSGRIIVVSSTSGEIGQAGQVNYSASKAGLIGAAKALAREIGKKNIFVNVVSPGVIDTEMTEDIPKDKLMPLIPLKRIGSVNEVASVIHFLSTDPDMYIHGQVIGVNGGLAI